MKQALVVAARELRERWLFFPAGLALGCVPLTLPAFGMRPENSPFVGLLIALVLGGAATLVAGATMLARDTASSRLGFLFSQPLGWPAIWGGKWLAAVVLGGMTGLLAAIPWMAVYPAPSGRSFFVLMLDLQGTVLALSWLIVLTGLANLGATSFLSRSVFVAFDLALLGVTVWGVRRYVPILLCGGHVGWRMTALVAALGLALLLASAVQVAVGRTDLRRAHRALSLTFWGLIVAMLVGAAGQLQWVLAAGPADISYLYAWGADPAGRWIQVRGQSRRSPCLDAAFLVEAPSGRYVRLRGPSDLLETDPLPSIPFLAFAERAGRAARWSTGSDRASTVLEVFDLSSSTPRVSRVRLEGVAEPQWRTLLRLSPEGTTALLVGASAFASLFDTTSGRRLATADVPRGSFAGEALFTSETGARIWLYDGDNARHVLDLAKGIDPKWSDFSIPPSASGGDWRFRGVMPVPDGSRVVSFDDGVRLRDGTTGALIATLVEGARWRHAGLLADGRIVVAAASEGRTWLSLFDRDGTPLREVELGPGGPVCGLLEVAPSQVAVGLGPFSTPKETAIVDVDSGQVVDRLMGLRPAETSPGAPARTGGTALFTESAGEIVSLDLATGERRFLAGPGAPRGQRIEPVLVSPSER
jgi:hypothetical protein